MSKERLDPQKMANELAGASAFFRRPTPSAPASEPASPAPVVPPGPPVSQERPKPHAPEPSDHPVRPGRDGRPTRRIMIRHPFEIYADQLEGLRELADQIKRQGENGSMSKMVRDAIDRLIDEQNT